jgi:hypothetical protein
MARLKETSKLIEGGEASTTAEDLVQLSSDEEDLAQVDASPLI